MMGHLYKYDGPYDPLLQASNGTLAPPLIFYWVPGHLKKKVAPVAQGAVVK